MQLINLLLHDSLVPPYLTRFKDSNYGSELRISMFCFPIELDCSFRIPEGEEEFIVWPKLYLQVVGTDLWGRTFAVGYGNTILSNRPGTFSESIPTWFPQGTIEQERTRFFLGGVPLLSDIRLSGIPTEFEGTFLNRYGFETENAGSVEIRYNCIHFRSPHVKRDIASKDFK